ncbi:hypothetical protein Aperf_G00000109226 [Anoplocephala perfoliata]
MLGLTEDDYIALILSGLFCSFVYITGQYLKKLIIFLFENESTSEAGSHDSTYLHKFIYVAFHDGVAAFQACACSLENAVFRVTLGNMSVLAAITIHGLLMLRYAWRDARGSTCDVFYRYLMKRTDPRGVYLSWVFQLLGAFCALRLSYLWWGLRLSTPHDRLHSYREHIRSLRRDGDDFQNLGDLQVPLLFGIFVESGVAFVDILMGAVVPALLSLWKHLQQRRHQQLRSGNNEFWMAEFVFFSVRQATSIYLIYLGLPLTGAYMNGVNAVIQTWGLGRASNPLYHIIVYWFSPLLGVWGGVKSVEVLRNTFTSFNYQSSSSIEPTSITVPVSEVPNDSTTNLPQDDANLDLPNRLRSKSLSEEYFDRSVLCDSSMNHLLELHWKSEDCLIIATATKSHFDNDGRFNDGNRSSPGRYEEELNVSEGLHRRHRRGLQS